MASTIEPEGNVDNLSDENQSTKEHNDTDESSTMTMTRTAGQTAIGAKLAKKLEKFAKENKQSNGKNPSTNSNNESELRRNINKTAKNIIETLTDSDSQKNLLALATKLAEIQEQNRLIQNKIHESEKKSVVLMRERDQVLLENGRITASKGKLESLCRELHQHNQQIREENIQRQQDDETKRRELATKFQTTIDEIASQLSNYSEKSTALRDQNAQLSEQLASVVKDYELRETEIEEELKKKELELRLSEKTLEQSRTLLNERTEVIKQERSVSEAEQLLLYKKCQELAASELSLRSQLTVYAERYQEFENAIQQSSQMVTSCHAEIEKMGKKIKQLEKERNEFRQRWETAEADQRKKVEDMKVLEKEKRQADIKLDKLDRLCRALQQERLDLQTTIKNLTKSSTQNETSTVVSSCETEKTVPNDVSNNSEISKTDADSSPNLYDSELGRIAKTVD